MTTILGINSIFHDPAAAVVIDGNVICAIEEERLSRRKGRRKVVPFSNWDFPELAVRWCIERAGLDPGEIEAVAYSFDPSLLGPVKEDVSADSWEGLLKIYAESTETYLHHVIPNLGSASIAFVPHHVSHAASAYLCGPFESSAVLVLDGRGETASHLAGVAKGRSFDVLAAQPLPHSLGWLYERLTEHLGFRSTADEYKVMGLARYGNPRFMDYFRRKVFATGAGGFVTEEIDWNALIPLRQRGQPLAAMHADLAASVQLRLEEVILDLASWLHDLTGESRLSLAGGVFFNCLVNSRLSIDGPFKELWVQPAAGDAGTALGSAMHLSAQLGDATRPLSSVALGHTWPDDEVEHALQTAMVRYERPRNLARDVANALVANKVVGWFQGAGEFGPRALGQRSIFAHPGHATNVERLNDIKGREQFRPVAPVVLADRAAAIFTEGPLPSPYMLFTHKIREEWSDRIPAVRHVDGTARIQTIDRASHQLLVEVLEYFDAATGLPILVNTSFNTSDRPIVNSPRDALECFGSTALDVLAIGPFVVSKV